MYNFTNQSDVISGWHFTGKTLRDGSPIPPVGKWLRHKGPIVLCQSGYHMSRRIVDALAYAPGPIIHRVEGRGDVIEEENIIVCRERRIVASINGKELLQKFIRECALSVIDKWCAPCAVRRYLETGDEALRNKAHAAATQAWKGAAARAVAIASHEAVYSTEANAVLGAAWAVVQAASEAKASWFQANCNSMREARLQSFNAAREQFNARLEQLFWSEVAKQKETNND